MTTPRVLIIDDDHLMRNSLVDLLDAAGWQTKALARATEAERWIAQFQPDVILSDVRMPEMSGLDLLTQLSNGPPVVLISAHGDIPTAVDAMNRGAYSFVEKPYDPKRLLLILTHASDQHRMRQDNLRLRAQVDQLSGLDRVLLGQTPQISQLRETLAVIAGTQTSVLIQGETGTGKDLAARALHSASGRADGPFIAVNAAQIGGDQLALIARNAAGGTLFLDEICACPADLQPALLRLIENKDVLLPGQGAPERIDLRIVAATNEDTEAAVQSGRLRQDLLFRLQGFVLHMPSLRDRLDDIPLLFARFSMEFATIYDTPSPDLTEADVADLMAHDWPGNVRELRSVVERRVILAKQGLGTMQDAILGNTQAQPASPRLREAVAAFERQMIGKAIQAHDGRMDEVAAALGIGRRTLNEKIVKLGLDKAALL